MDLKERKVATEQQKLEADYEQIVEEAEGISEKDKEFKQYIELRQRINMNRIMGGSCKVVSRANASLWEKARKLEKKHQDFRYWFYDMTDEEIDAFMEKF